MITLRKSQARGHANHEWLDSYHSFSFAEYDDPEHMQYSVLRVINEDKIAPNAGFGMHSHRDMEIITYMLAGELKHQDSMGNVSVIRAGDVQRISAGTGIRHSEVNLSTVNEVHFLQIWILPSQEGLPPSYQDQQVTLESKLNGWRLIASPDARKESLFIHQDVELWAVVLEKECRLDYVLHKERCIYMQLARGQVEVNGQLLTAGDAVMVELEHGVCVQAQTEAEILLFDLPMKF